MSTAKSNGYVFRKGFPVLFMLAFLFLLPARGQLKFNSGRLEQVFSMLPASTKEKITEDLSGSPGEHFFNIKKNELTRVARLRINEYYEISHLGLYLISDSPGLPSLSVVFDYLEREFLYSLLADEKYPLQHQVNFYRTEVYFNGKKIGDNKLRASVPEIVITPENPFRIVYDDLQFTVEWTTGVSKLQVRIPNNYAVISGKTKDELENDLLRKIKHPESMKYVAKVPVKTQLKFYKPRIYTYQQDQFYKDTELSSGKFYIINDTVQPVFNRLYYKESINNLFLNLVPTGLDLSVTQKLYGGREETVKTNINSFFNNFNFDHILYFGWQNASPDSLKASIIICNTRYNYNHLLQITTDVKTVFGKNGEVKGTLYAFIPIESMRKKIEIK